MDSLIGERQTVVFEKRAFGLRDAVFNLFFSALSIHICGAVLRTVCSTVAVALFVVALL